MHIGDREIDKGRAYIIAEIGINHNGSVDTAIDLIDAAKVAGCDAVKFQKRTVDVVYTSAELDKTRETPFGTTNRELKEGLELGQDAYERIDAHCGYTGISWFASAWDVGALEFINQFGPPAYKIASASITDLALLQAHKDMGKPVIMSTGMSTLAEVEWAVDELWPDEDLILLHCNSEYPTRNLEDLNLSCMKMLREEFNLPVGYSGHEVGLSTTIAAAVLGACVIERHITLDRSKWGSDQSASVEPHGFSRMVRDVRAVEKAMGTGEKLVTEAERVIKKKLRRVDDTG